MGVYCHERSRRSFNLTRCIFAFKDVDHLVGDVRELVCVSCKNKAVSMKEHESVDMRPEKTKDEWIQKREEDNFLFYSIPCSDPGAKQRAELTQECLAFVFRSRFETVYLTSQSVSHNSPSVCWFWRLVSTRALSLINRIMWVCQKVTDVLKILLQTQPV